MNVTIKHSVWQVHVQHRRKLGNRYHSIVGPALNKISMRIDHFQHVRRQLVHVGDWTHAKRNNAALSGKCSDVAVYSDVYVLAYHQRTLGIGSVFLQKLNCNNTV